MVAWQIENVLFPLSQGLWTPNLGWGDLTYEVMWNIDYVVMWQTKNVVSPLPQGLWTPNLAGWCLRWGDPTHNVTWHFNIVVTWQIKNVIFPLSYSVRTTNLAEWWLRMRKMHPRSHVTHQLCGHMASQKYFVFTFTRPKVHKLSRMVTRMRRPHPTCHVPPLSRRHATTI